MKKSLETTKCTSCKVIVFIMLTPRLFFSDRSFQAPQVASELMTTRIMALTDETFGSSDRSNHGLILDETRILGKWSPWRDTALSAQWRSPFWRDHLPSLWTVPVLGTVKVKKLCGDSPITSHHGLRNHTNPLYYGEKRCPQWNNLIHYNHHALIWFYSNSTTKIHDSVKSWIRFFFPVDMTNPTVLNGFYYYLLATHRGTMWKSQDPFRPSQNTAAATLWLDLAVVFDVAWWISQWLVGGFKHLETYESMGRVIPYIMENTGKYKMFETTKQVIMIVWWIMDLNASEKGTIFDLICMWFLSGSHIGI